MVDEELIELIEKIKDYKAEFQTIEVKSAHGGCPVFTVTKYEGKNIVSAEIPSADLSERPCFYTGIGRIRGSYIRSGDSDEQ